MQALFLPFLRFLPNFLDFPAKFYTKNYFLTNILNVLE